MAIREERMEERREQRDQRMMEFFQQGMGRCIYSIYKMILCSTLMFPPPQSKYFLLFKQPYLNILKVGYHLPAQLKSHLPYERGKGTIQV